MKNRNLRRLRATVQTGNFPANLTTSERACVEAIAEFGCRKVAADRLCISLNTLGDHLKAAAIKAGVNKTVVIVARYLKATEEAAA